MPVTSLSDELGNSGYHAESDRGKESEEENMDEEWLHPRYPDGVESDNDNDENGAGSMPGETAEPQQQREDEQEHAVISLGTRIDGDQAAAPHGSGSTNGINGGAAVGYPSIALPSPSQQQQNSMFTGGGAACVGGVHWRRDQQAWIAPKPEESDGEDDAQGDGEGEGESLGFQSFSALTFGLKEAKRHAVAWCQTAEARAGMTTSAGYCQFGQSQQPYAGGVEGERGIGGADSRTMPQQSTTCAALAAAAAGGVFPPPNTDATATGAVAGSGCSGGDGEPADSSIVPPVDSAGDGKSADRDDVSPTGCIANIPDVAVYLSLSSTATVTPYGVCISASNPMAVPHTDPPPPSSVQPVFTMAPVTAVTAAAASPSKRRDDSSSHNIADSLNTENEGSGEQQEVAQTRSQEKEGISLRVNNRMYHYDDDGHEEEEEAGRHVDQPSPPTAAAAADVPSLPPPSAAAAPMVIPPLPTPSATVAAGPSVGSQCDALRDDKKHDDQENLLRSSPGVNRGAMVERGRSC